MRIAGSFPNPVVLRKGWARAEARPWNRNRTDAYLRLVRGTTAFLVEATQAVLGFGVSAVTSPPLLAGSRRTWLEAGFQPYRSLLLFHKPLAAERLPEGVVEELNDLQWLRLVEIDGSAFGPRWRAELPALREALASAPRSVLLGAMLGSGLSGYAIAAVSGGTGYLQRLAVDAAAQGRGLGRDLTRASCGWAQRRGARRMVLNTKPDNDAARALYGSEGFTVMSEHLELMQFVPTDR